jgi:hypothetical protein
MAYTGRRVVWDGAIDLWCIAATQYLTSVPVIVSLQQRDGNVITRARSATVQG